MPKERPILFSTEMVKAILDGRKTQTRRVIKPQPKYCEKTDSWQYGKNFKNWSTVSPDQDLLYPFESPYGKPGDLLWVRETWRPCTWNEDGDFGIEFKTGEVLDFWFEEDGLKYQEQWVNYLLNKGHQMIVPEGAPEDEGYFDLTENPFPWKPSIHMPKEMSRIWLEVKDVRVERLQDISDKDAIAEGIKREEDAFYFYPCADLRDDTYIADPVCSFYSLWRSIKGDASWQENPFVWAVSSKVLSTEGRPNVH